MHTVVNHPLLQHRLAILRATKTDPKLFRELVHEMTRLIAFEALRDLPTVPVSVRTPMGDAAGVKIEGHVVVAPILRAGEVVEGRASRCRGRGARCVIRGSPRRRPASGRGRSRARRRGGRRGRA